MINKIPVWIKQTAVIVLLLFGMMSVAAAYTSDSMSFQLQKRKFLSETLATVVAIELDRKLQHNDKILVALRNTVEGDADVTSAAVRKADGSFIASFGNHQKYWTLSPQEKSKPTQVQAPLFKGSTRIATVEISFKELKDSRKISSRSFFSDALSLYARNDLIRSEENHESLKELLQAVVRRNKYILSAAVRRSDGTVLALAGTHEKNWKQTPQDKSKDYQLQTPVYDASQQVGTVEVVVFRKSFGYRILSAILGDG